MGVGGLAQPQHRFPLASSELIMARPCGWMASKRPAAHLAHQATVASGGRRGSGAKLWQKPDLSWQHLKTLAWHQEKYSASPVRRKTLSAQHIRDIYLRGHQRKTADEDEKAGIKPCSSLCICAGVVGETHLATQPRSEKAGSIKSRETADKLSGCSHAAVCRSCVHGRRQYLG